MTLVANRKQLRNAYNDWMNEHVDDFIEDVLSNRIKQGLEPILKDDYLKQYGYYITFTFHEYSNLKLNNKEDISGDLFKNLDHFYNLICQKLLGRRYYKLKCKQPKVIGSLDSNGSRYGQTVDRIENAHIHSIWVIHPDQKSMFEDVMTYYSDLIEIQKFRFKNIHVEDITSSDSSRLIEYNNKFLVQAAEKQMFKREFEIYPRNMNTSN